MSVSHFKYLKTELMDDKHGFYFLENIEYITIIA